jgi:DNA invertase Pin-like site-specific DNA recombinase
MFGMLGVFAEFEREMIVARVNAGLARAKDAIARDGRFTTKAGKVRTRLGRPGALPDQIEAARGHLAAGTGIGKTARLTGLSTGAVHSSRARCAARDVLIRQGRRTGFTGAAPA